MIGVSFGATPPSRTPPDDDIFGIEAQKGYPPTSNPDDAAAAALLFHGSPMGPLDAAGPVAAI